jgi:hypothetical protein
MGGPIVRTGTTPKFWQNWEQVFGSKKRGATKKAAVQAKPAKPAKEVKGPKKAATKAVANKAVAKKAKKTGGKKK